MSESVFRRAAERLLEIIGEAANVIGDDTRAQHPEVAWTDVTRLRVVLPHRYHRVDADQVRVIARDEIPALVAALEGDHGERALSETPSQPTSAANPTHPPPTPSVNS